ncbi:MAG TPA: ABC transporter permease, partial [Sphingomonas sp.]|nr:ABC transporter permease [Sphingomonas sp.]
MSLAWRLAIRDLRAGGRGLWLLALCLFLGTAALAGIGSLSASILGALDDQSRAMLGGDLEMRVSQRRATVEEAAAFAAAGRTAETIRTRAMVQPLDGSAAALVTLKAVDEAWPLVGQFRLAPGARDARPHGREVAIAPALADRLGLHVGDAVRLGAARMTVIGLIADEPDKLGEGFNLGPTVLVDRTGLDATGVIQPGSLYESRYRLLLPPGSDASAIGDRFVHRFPSAGWTARTPDQAAGSLRKGIAQLGQFLLLVGLAALAIAGVGVGSGVSAYLAGKTRIIATLKVLGARSGAIASIFLIQLGLVAAGGIGAGLVLGAAVPAIVAA